MKRILLIALAMATLSGAASAQGYGYSYGTGSNPSSVHVDGYTRSNGVHVDSYERTAPNTTQLDNYGSRGNVNPYNGNVGTHSPRY